MDFFLESYISFVCVLDFMIVHRQDAKVPKQVLNTLIKMYNTNAQVCKMEFKKKLHNLQKKLSINDYFMNVKKLIDFLLLLESMYMMTIQC
jgi:hypothetical protein